MSHRDVSSDSSLNLVQLQAALNSLLANCDFSAVNWKSQCTWTPRLLASVALLWAWCHALACVGMKLLGIPSAVCALWMQGKHSRGAMKLIAMTPIHARGVSTPWHPTE